MAATDAPWDMQRAKKEEKRKHLEAVEPDAARRSLCFRQILSHFVDHRLHRRTSCIRSTFGNRVDTFDVRTVNTGTVNTREKDSAGLFYTTQGRKTIGSRISWVARTIAQHTTKLH